MVRLNLVSGSFEITVSVPRSRKIIIGNGNALAHLCKERSLPGLPVAGNRIICG